MPHAAALRQGRGGVGSGDDRSLRAPLACTGAERSVRLPVERWVKGGARSAILPGMQSPFDDSIAFAQVSSAAPEALLPAEAACLSPRAVQRRRDDFVNGRAAAAACLAQLGHPRVPILRGSDRAPVWPEGLIGAISHSGGVALAAVARAADWSAIGVDLQGAVSTASTLVRVRRGDAAPHADGL